MKELSQYLSVARIMTVTGLLFLLCAVVLTACGGGEADPEQAEIGKMLQAEGWEVTLAELPEKENIVGEGGITNQAQGIFVIVLVKVVNQNQDILLLPPELVKLRDSQGREFKPTGSTAQFAYLQGKPGIDLLIDSPLKAGENRNGVLIYDVPTDAAGLLLTMEGIEDTINLGF